ncbi:glutaminyl-peptide cyclotransferase [Desulfonatronum thioautotrophicum]|uniref:glutaminyl-peptide cyclotransferase n=1 Tax=Desulfonatronum thioautotrophicum TaxID=617001 RepID=UPI000AC09572|nr:glutaminyl-peptide cyclotransferase [Desulfonatronum thioautotrophicum]
MHRRGFLALITSIAVLSGMWALRLPPSRLFAQPGPFIPRQKSFRIINTYPHDPEAFTQGLLFHEGYLYESTGGWGTSSLRKVDLITGRVLRKRDLSPQYFGEGLAVWDGRLIQVTWKSGTGFVYDLHTFDQLETFTYPGEGWGLTQDEQGLILGDGTHVLRRLDPSTFRETGRIMVHDQGRPQRGLNELEYIQGEIWAKIFPTDEMVSINPEDGRIMARIDLSGILGPRRRASSDAVPNGIAYDQEKGRIFVTGKLWPVLFEIEIVPSS